MPRLCILACPCRNECEIFSRALATLFTAQRRSLIVSQSTFVGSGKYGGYWETNNTRSWEHLKNSINVMLSYSIYGIPLVRSDACL